MSLNFRDRVFSKLIWKSILSCFVINLRCGCIPQASGDLRNYPLDDDSLRNSFFWPVIGPQYQLSDTWIQILKSGPRTNSSNRSNSSNWTTRNWSGKDWRRCWWKAKRRHCLSNLRNRRFSPFGLQNFQENNFLLAKTG